MIKNLVFDLGNVLIEWNSEKILTYFEPEKERRQVLRQAIFESGVWHQTDKGELSLKEACEEVLTQLDASYHSAIKNIFYHWYEVVYVYSDLQERIRLWVAQDYRIYILSTTCEIFYHIEKAGLLPIYPLLSGYILSSEVGVVKPEAEIYQKLLKKYNLNPVESVFIDDIQANLDTAAELGFETILSTSETENIRAMETLLAAKGKFD
ncbi:Alpha-D-glucose-1-phosphate phosphatase YihX [Streptococcus sanguinis]|uniref:HAD family hydrolase n=1 Tax=Streptococcus TaxID=1301 RepID=UPI000F9ED54E|nr:MULTISPECIES: HAD family phosphatase [Streptococcus]MBZ2058252.1 HAD family phosphatase [Streptococcus sanguinis]MDN5013140.1 HAD family phosphatase [Streptococcus sp. SN3]RSH97460.1 Alpha-D-glucose-1-phosphate phosphatase YihX [Streptococcus sanguinis]RSI04404.1 Alpha-D-glucose-1-phosphate phosphatase YihX [Streptococcus sanguinis]